MDEVAKAFVKGVTARERKVKDKIYKNVFSGSQAVEFLISSGLASNKEQAIRVGNSLMKKGLFSHVTNDHTFLDSDSLWYKYTPGATDIVVEELHENESTLESDKKSKRKLAVVITDGGVEVFPSQVSSPTIDRKTDQSSVQESVVTAPSNTRKGTFASIILQNKPSARMGHSAVIFQDRMWIYGGRGEKNHLADLNIFSFRSKNWITGPPYKGSSPGQRRSHISFTVNEKLYLFGGYSGSKTFSDMHEYDPCNFYLYISKSEKADPKWTEIKYQSNPPPSSYMGTGVIYNGCFYIYGGDSDQMSQIWKFDLSTRVWAEVKNSKHLERRSGHTAVVWQNSMFVFGGTNKSNWELNELWEYDFTTNTWAIVMNSPGAPPPPPRYGHSAVIADNCMWIFGGGNKDGFLSDFWKFSFEKRQWIPVTPESLFKNPSAKRFHSVVAYKDNIFLFGGMAPKGLRNSIYKYSTKKNRWRKVQLLLPMQNDVVATKATVTPIHCPHKQFGCTFVGTTLNLHLMSCYYEKVKGALFSLQSKINEQESEINHLREQIKKLETSKN